MPSRTASVRLRPRPSRSSTSTTRSECSLCQNRSPKRSARHSSSASSPMWPNGGWPRSCPSPIASVRSSLSAQRARDGARDLRDLERVRQPRAVVVAGRQHEHLRLVLEPAERLAVHDPVAVALKRRPQPAVGLVELAYGRVRARRERRQIRLLAGLHPLRERVGDGPARMLVNPVHITILPGEPGWSADVRRPRKRAAGEPERDARRSRESRARPSAARAPRPAARSQAAGRAPRP